jgi:hypothetical protein
MHDAGSIRFDGWRNLLQRRLAAARHKPSHEHAAATATRADECGCLHDTRSVHRDGRGHLLQRWLAAAGRDASFGRACVNAAASTATAVDSAVERQQHGMHDAGSVQCDGRRHLL